MDETDEYKDTIIDSNPDRERGILTPHDRKFLRAGEGEGVRADMDENAVRQKRYKIRQRFREALIDIQYLLLLDDRDLARLFPSGERGDYETGFISGGVFAAVYHLLRTEYDYEGAVDFIEQLVVSDIVGEYAREYGVYAAGVEMTVNVPDINECSDLEQVLAAYRNGEDIPRSAHLALDDAGLHPNPEEYL